MKKAQKDLLAEIWDDATPLAGAQWEKPQRADPVKTQKEAIILASVVEKETGNTDEQPMVAAAMVNRLTLGMRLQADSTTVYGITKGVPIGRIDHQQGAAPSGRRGTPTRSTACPRRRSAIPARAPFAPC